MCITAEKPSEKLTEMREAKQTKILKAIKLGGVYYLPVHVLFWKNMVARQPHLLV